MSKLTQSQLESYLWGAATLLRGYIDAGDYKQYIFPLLFFKRMCDVYDEEYELALKESDGDKDYASFAENHRFVIPEDAHWNVIREAGKNVGKVIQTAIRKIESANTDKLYGIFGDAQWTNKDRLPDRTLKEMVEHFSSQTLSIANCPEDELGVGYEYLIKKFADDSGHTAAEFYTNRTVVHLMTELLKPKPGESIYDPTCGSGGMLLSSITHLQSQKKEWRNVGLFGQERNLMTSAIARMNCFLHGVEDFEIVRGDTLSNPKFVEGDRLRQFDVVLANPPYSIKQWDREAFSADPWGRNIYGTPPQSCADFAFWQHIVQSMHPESGRCAILFPHGVLFRINEQRMRSSIVEKDLVEAVIGLGRNMFYNSAMPACIVICNSRKVPKRRGKTLFIDASAELLDKGTQSFLEPAHIQRIAKAYLDFKDEIGFAGVVSTSDLIANKATLRISAYVGEKHDRVRSSQNRKVDVVPWHNASVRLRRSANKFSRAKSSRRVKDSPTVVKLERKPTTIEGTIVRNNEQCSDLAKAGIDRFVKVEHLDLGSLKLKRWGDVTEVDLPPTFRFIFRAGMVLYPTRSPKLPQYVAADFDGICGEKTLVLRTKDESKLPSRLLPFLMSSPDLYDYANSVSVGSVNAHVRWRDLAEYQFRLPVPGDRERLSDLLWCVEEVLRTYEDTVASLKNVVNSITSSFLTQEWDRQECIELLKTPPRNGLSPKANSEGDGFPTLSLSAIREGKVNAHGTNLKYAVVPEEKLERFRLHHDDILVVRGNGNPNRCGKCGIVNVVPTDCFYPDLLIRLEFDAQKILPAFACVQWNYVHVHQRLISRAKSTNGIWKINGKDVRQHWLFVPPMKHQIRFLAEIDEPIKCLDATRAAIVELRKLQSSLLRKYLPRA